MHWTLIVGLDVFVLHKRNDHSSIFLDISGNEIVRNETDFSIVLLPSLTCSVHECFPAGGAATYTSNDPSPQNAR